MQKKILAAVIGGLLASPAVFADSANVTISGRFAIGVENYKLSAGGTATPAASYNTEQRVSDQSSSLIFSGSEDLGGGNKAWFQIDNRFQPDSQSAFGASIGASGNTLAGLQGGWGKLGLGKSDLHYNELAALDYTRSGSLQTYHSAGPFSQVNGVTIANGTRTPNVVMWDSPNWGGITARLAYSTQWSVAKDLAVVTVTPATVPTVTTTQPNEGSGRSATAGDNPGKGDAIQVAVRWAGGPLSAGVSHWDAKTEGSSDVGDQKSDRAYVGYKMDALTVGFGYDVSKIRATAGADFSKRNAMLVPVRFTFGAETLYFSYAKMDKTEVPGLGKVDNTDASAYMIGFDHAMSKRTSVGVYYSVIDNKALASYDLFGLGASGATTTNAGEDAKQIYLGFVHFY